MFQRNILEHQFINKHPFIQMDPRINTYRQRLETSKYSFCEFDHFNFKYFNITLLEYITTIFVCIIWYKDKLGKNHVEN